jgi:hypothetical protein
LMDTKPLAWAADPCLLAILGLIPQGFQEHGALKGSNDARLIGSAWR